MEDEEELASSDDEAGLGAAAIRQQGKKNAMLLLLGRDYSVATADDPESEVNNYIRENPPDLDTNPLTWWSTNHRRFPRLAKLASRYLCIPEISVPSERVFSSAGLTVNRLHTRLTPEHVDMLIFLNKNQ